MSYTIVRNTETHKWGVFYTYYNPVEVESFDWYVDAKKYVEAEEEQEWDETCSCCGKNLSDLYGYKLTEQQFDNHPERNDGYDEECAWFCPDCRED